MMIGSGVEFKVNGIYKKWKLQKAGYIDNRFIERFSVISQELSTKGKYTYFDNGGQQFVIDYATEYEQANFNKITGLKREWLCDVNKFH